LPRSPGVKAASIPGELLRAPPANLRNLVNPFYRAKPREPFLPGETS